MKPPKYKMPRYKIKDSKFEITTLGNFLAMLQQLNGKGIFKDENGYLYEVRVLYRPTHSKKK